MLLALQVLQALDGFAILPELNRKVQELLFELCLVLHTFLKYSTRSKIALLEV